MSLPLPGFHDPANAARWSYRPDESALAAEATRFRGDHGIRPAGEDRRRIHLLLIDVQKDFCFPEGSLYVGGRSGTGAVEDSARIASFLYRNLGAVTETTVTLDTHFPHQIFFPSFWVDAEGTAPAPHREVRAADIRDGRLVPSPALATWVAGGDLGWIRKQVEFYAGSLERAGKYTLYLWPPHCLLGGEGHTLAGVVQEARLFHAFARGAEARVEIKGGNPLTENYSVFAPEVLLRHDGGSLAGRNDALVDRLLAEDAIVVAGQASSHCVKSSVDDLLEAMLARDPRLARKLYVLSDCMSAVAVPDPARPGAFLADFTPQAEAALARWADAGVNVVRSTDPVEEWGR